MTMPRTLDMVSTAQGLRLISRPVAELESLRQPLSLTEHREANRLTMQSQTDIMQSEWWFEFRLPLLPITIIVISMSILNWMTTWIIPAMKAKAWIVAKSPMLAI